jgi:hypothetical protein
LSSHRSRRTTIVSRIRRPGTVHLRVWGLLFGLCLSMAGVAAGQSEGIWQVFLNGNQVTALTAADEEVWAATIGGVVRILPDGTMTQWNRSSGGLLSDSVSCAAVDASGNLWFGTAQVGISVLERSGRWRSITSLTEPIPGDRIRRIRFFGTAEAETMLVATMQGFAVFLNGEAREVCLEDVDICGIPSYNVGDLLQVGDSMWIATAGGIAVRYPPRGEQPGGWRDHSIGLNFPAPTKLARSDSLYAAGQSGLFVWRGSRWARVPLPGSDSGTVVTPSDMIADGASLVLAGIADPAAGGGVFRRSGGVWSRVGQPLRNITSVAMTASGRFFAGAADPYEISDGYWSLEGDTWSHRRLNGPSLRAAYLSIAFDPEGAMWLSSVQNQVPPMITRYRDGQWSFFPGGQGGRSNAWTFRLLAAGNAVWLAHCCCGSIDPPDKCNMEQATEGGDLFERWPFAEAWDLDQDDQGYLWVGTQNDDLQRQHGIYRVNTADSSWVQIWQENEPRMVSDQVSAIKVSGRVAWIGYKGDGFSRFDLGADGKPLTEDDAWQSFRAPATGNGLINDNVRRIRVGPDGRVWVGTTEGLSIYDGTRFTNVGAGLGRLPKGEVTAIIPTKDGGGWVATRDGGLTRMTPREPSGFRYTSYGPPDLPNPNIEDMAIGPDGRTLWLATSRGIASFFPPPDASESSAGVMGAYPNPFRIECGNHHTVRLIGAGGVAGGVIVDLSGQIVAQFHDCGPEDAIWDARQGSVNGSGGGERVAPGLYWIRASTPTGVHSIGLAVMDAGCEP